MIRRDLDTYITPARIDGWPLTHASLDVSPVLLVVSPKPASVDQSIRWIPCVRRPDDPGTCLNTWR